MLLVRVVLVVMWLCCVMSRCCMVIILVFLGMYVLVIVGLKWVVFGWC